mmetsp:Transcript_63445/g.185505  ORF Transcript_63445/g.185505 Transcript_63445/m.185505 type:complete len:352 (+) Transcript_63445:13-1068(+)
MDTLAPAMAAVPLSALAPAVRSEPAALSDGCWRRPSTLELIVPSSRSRWQASPAAVVVSAAALPLLRALQRGRRRPSIASRTSPFALRGGALAGAQPGARRRATAARAAPTEFVAPQRPAGKSPAEEEEEVPSGDFDADVAKRAAKISLRDRLEGEEARIWDDLAAKMRPFVMEELKDDMMDEAWDAVRDELRSTVKSGLKEALEEEVLEDLREELQAEYDGPAAEDDDSDEEEEEEDEEEQEDEELGDEPVSAAEAWREEAAARRSAMEAAAGEGVVPNSAEAEKRERFFWDVREELRREMKSESWTQLCNELAPDVADELEEELRGEAVAELRYELEDEVRRDLGWAAS